MRRAVIAFSLAALGAASAAVAAVPADPFGGRGRLTVNPIGPDSFRVEWEPSFADVEYWCAAGEFLLRAGLPGATRVYRLSPPPRKVGKGMDFTLDPEKAVEPGITVFGAPDAGLTATSARALCADRQR